MSDSSGTIFQKNLKHKNSFKIFYAYIISLYSIICLHTNGRLRKIFLYASYDYTPPGFYYPFDFEDIAINKDNSTGDNVNNDEIAFNGINVGYPSLGAGDFLVFNFMSLLIIDPLWPITTKLYVFVGCIVSIQIGHFIMRIVQFCWREPCMPTLPFAVITFSTYAAFIYPFMYNTTMESINTQLCT